MLCYGNNPLLMLWSHNSQCERLSMSFFFLWGRSSVGYSYRDRQKIEAFGDAGNTHHISRINIFVHWLFSESLDWQRIIPIPWGPSFWICDTQTFWDNAAKDQWEFQDPKMKGLYHISGHMNWGISPYIALKNRPKIYGRYLHFRILKFPLICMSIMVVWHSH